MARMRTLKPQFFLNELLAEIDPLGRLLFQGLWCIADRDGRLEDRPKRIKAEVLPYDDADVDHLLRLLHEAGFILRYVHEGQRYIQVVNFAKHQSPHVKEAPSTIPAPCLPDASPMQAPYTHSASTELAPPVMGMGTVTDPGMEIERERTLVPAACSAQAAPTHGALALSPLPSSSISPSSTPSSAPKLVPFQPPKPVKPAISKPTRAPDHLWDACIAACGGIAPSNKVERGKWNKGVAALRESGATPEEIAIRAARYRRRYGERIALNPMALAGNWTQLATDIRTDITATEVTSHADNYHPHSNQTKHNGNFSRPNDQRRRSSAQPYNPQLPTAEDIREWARREREAGRPVIGG